MTSAEISRERLTGLVRVIVPHYAFEKAPHLVQHWQTQFSKLRRECEIVSAGDESFGAALRHGLTDNSAPLVMLLVPEWPFRPTELKALLDAADVADCVCGVRAGAKRSSGFERWQRIFGIMQRIVVGVPAGESSEWYGWPMFWRRLRYRIIYGLRSQDPECGLVLIRKEVLDRCPIQSNGRFALVELLAKANFVGALMAEVKLNRAGDMPVMKTPFSSDATDPARVFRKPQFNDVTKKTAGTDEPVPAADVS